MPIVISNLTPNTFYEFQFGQECIGSAQISWSNNSAQGTTLPNDVCINPNKTDVIIGTVTQTTIPISWVAFPANNVFEIRYKLEGSNTWMPSLNISGTTAVISNLTAGKKYTVELRRVVGTSICEWLLLDPITTIEDICKPVDINQVVFTPTQTSINVAWVEGVNPALSYEVRYRKTGTTSWIQVGLAAVTSFIAENLTPDTEYEFEVKRICQFGASLWIPIGKAKTLIINTLPEPSCNPTFTAPVSTNPTLLSVVNKDQVVYINGIAIKLTKVSSPTYAEFNGEGIAVIPFNKEPLKVTFKGLKIDQSFIVVAGSVEGVKDDPANFPNLTPTILNLTSFSCKEPKTKPGFDSNGLYQPGNSKTNPNGFNVEGVYKSDPLYSCQAATDKVDTQYDPRGFDSKGIHIITKTIYDSNGCDINGLKSDKKTPCTCYKPCEPCNVNQPYFWLNGGSSPSDAGNKFANDQKANLPNLIITVLDKLIAKANTELTERRADCSGIKTVMDDKLSQLQYDSKFVYGEINQYVVEGMSKNFKSAPKISLTNNNGVRNTLTEDLEAKHVDLYNCDIKVIAYLDFHTLLNELKNDKTKFDLLNTTIFELIRRLDDKTVQGFKADPATFSNWIFEKLEEYGQKSYNQVFGKNLVQIDVEQNKVNQQHLGFPPIPKSTPEYSGLALANQDENDIAKLLLQSQEISSESINFEYQQGFQTIAGLDRAIVLEAICKERALVEDITAIDKSKLPIEITKIIAGNTYSIYLDNIRIKPGEALLDAYLILTIPGTTDKILFKGTDIKFGGGGLLGGTNQPRLYLQTDIGVGINNVARFVLKGSANKTFAEWDCDGFKQLSLDADVQFCRQYFTPLDKDLKPITDLTKLVTASFTTVTPEWGNFETSMSITNFAITKYPDYKFVVKDVIFDYSKTLQPNPIIKFPDNYGSQSVVKGVAKPEWIGFFLGKLDVTLPKMFKSKTAGQLVAFVENMVVDDEGLTGIIGVKTVGKPILPLDDGDLNGWAYSIDKFAVKVVQNEITGGGFGGLVNIPILSDKDATTKTSKIEPKDCFRYDALVSPGTGEYLFTVETGAEKEFKLNMLKAKVTISDDTHITIGVVGDDFIAKAVVNGTVTFLGDYSATKKMEKMAGVGFTNLTVSNTKPYFNPGNWTLPATPKLGFQGFSITFSKLSFSELPDGDKTAMNFDVKIGLTSMDTGDVTQGTTPPPAETDEQANKDKFKLDVTGGFRITGKLGTDDLGRQRWEYDDFTINEVLIDGSFPGVKKLFGYAKFFDEATPDLKGKNFGHGFQGGIDVTFDGVEVEIKAVALFGRTKNKEGKEYKYFMVDAMGYFDKLNINVGGLNLVGFGGGAYYHMSRDETKFLALSLTKEVKIPTTVGQSLTGIYYLPDDEKFVGIRAIAAFELPKSEKAFNCNVMFGIEFNKNYGLSEILFLGNATFFDKIKLDKVPKFVAKGVDPEAGLNLSVRASIKIVVKFDKETELLAGMDVYANLGGIIKGGGAGDRLGGAEFYSKGKDWHLNIGTPNEKERVSLVFAIKDVQIGSLNAYFCIGTKVPPMPDLPQSIKNATGLTNFMANESTRSSGAGFAFGANLNFDIAEKSFLIFYASFKAEMGFDVMLKDYGNTTCLNLDNKPIGINGWYASGQLYAGLQADIGIKTKIWGQELKLPIMKMGAAVVLQAKLPNPFWARGSVGGYYSILGGALKGSCSFVVTIGQVCEIEGTDPNVQEAIIADINPTKDEDNVPVTSSMTVDFNFPTNKTWTEADVLDPNKSFTYAIKYEYIRLKYAGYTIPGTEDVSEDGKLITFTPSEILPGSAKLTLEVKAFLTKNGTIIKTEEKSVVFNTGKAVTRILVDNIEAAYPARGQYNFYRNEFKDQEGYIMLKRSQRNLFDDNAQYKAILKDNNGTCFSTTLKYDADKNTVQYDLPADKIVPEAVYQLLLAKYDEPVNPYQGLTGNKISGNANVCPSNLPDWKILYESYFRASKFEYFIDKVNSVLDVNLAQSNNSSDLVLNIVNNTEPFDLKELSGDGTNPAFASFAFGITTSDWYKKSIFQKLYTVFPYSYGGGEIADFGRSGKNIPEGVQLLQTFGATVEIMPEDFKKPSVLINTSQLLNVNTVNVMNNDMNGAKQSIETLKNNYINKLASQCQCSTQYGAFGNETHKKYVTGTSVCTTTAGGYVNIGQGSGPVWMNGVTTCINTIDPFIQTVYSSWNVEPLYSGQYPLRVTYNLPGLNIKSTNNASIMVNKN